MPANLPFKLTAAGFALMLLTLSACNTVRGVGEDVSSAGEAVSGASEDVQEDL